MEILYDIIPVQFGKKLVAGGDMNEKKVGNLLLGHIAGNGVGSVGIRSATLAELVQPIQKALTSRKPGGNQQALFQ